MLLAVTNFTLDLTRATGCDEPITKSAQKISSIERRFWRHLCFYCMCFVLRVTCVHDDQNGIERLFVCLYMSDGECRRPG